MYTNIFFLLKTIDYKLHNSKKKKTYFHNLPEHS